MAETREEEMRSALASIGIFWMPDEDAGDGCASWCTTLEPHGEEPADSLAAALERTMCASANDELRARLAESEQKIEALETCISETNIRLLRLIDKHRIDLTKESS